MTQSTKQTRNAESGFTLVELAIVMIIIGLLIGGILKGQELINNARVSATVAQVKAVESGISGFRDKYAGMPGDLTNAAGRVPGCAGLCATNGNGNNIVPLEGANNPGIAQTAAGTTEGTVAFVQLAAAGFVGGVQPNTPTGNNGAERTNPATPLGGAWQFSYSDGAATAVTGLVAANTGAGFALSAGHYMASVLNLATAAGGTNVFMLPVQAAAIDRKLDDGTPNGGSVRAFGGVTATGCATGAANTDTYREAVGTAACGILAKVQ